MIRFALSLLVFSLLIGGCSTAGDEAKELASSELCVRSHFEIRDGLGDDCDYLLVIDNMACGTCMKELVGGVNRGRANSVGVLVAENMRSYIAPMLDTTKSVMITRHTSDLQRCFPTEYSTALYRWADTVYVMEADISAEQAREYGELIAAIEKTTSQ